MMKRHTVGQMGTVAAMALCLVAPVLRAEPWKHVTEEGGLPARQVQFIERDGERMWVGTLGGLTVFKDGKPTVVVQGKAVWDVLPAALGRTWIGSGDGVVWQQGAATGTELEGESVGRVAAFGTNAVWVLCTRGDVSRLMEFSSGTWRPVAAFKDRRVTDMHVTRDGNVWVVLKANGLVEASPVQRPDLWVHHHQGVNVTAFHEDAQQQVWCGTWARGIMVREKGAWTRMLTQEEGAVTAIRKDAKGNVWAATNDRGVWQYDGAKWINHLEEEGMINLLESTTDGRILVSSQSVCSLRQWNGTAWEALLDVPTMFIATVCDAKGKIWAGNILDGLYIQP